MKAYSLIPTLVIGLLIFILPAISAQAQYVTGPNPVNVCATETYSFNNGTTYPSVNWATPNGTIITKWNNGNTYYATVQWNTVGTANLSLLDNTYYQRGVLSVTIQLGNPFTTFTTVQNCN